MIACVLLSEERQTGRLVMRQPVFTLRALAVIQRPFRQKAEPPAVPFSF